MIGKSSQILLGWQHRLSRIKTRLTWVVGVGSLITALPGAAADPDPSDWEDILNRAKGQTLYFNAWGGDSQINGFIDWVGDQLDSLFDITVRHVKVTDTTEVVSRVLAEKQAGNHARGAVDLIWINGENFSAMQQRQLLFGPWAEQLPNFVLVDADKHPEMRVDFGVPTQGFESPWTRSQLVFYFDSAVVTEPPSSMRELLQWVQGNPSEFAYPRPPDFSGTTFLKQALLELVPSADPLYQPVNGSTFEELTRPLWQYLDQLHPQLLRSGRSFPSGAPQLRRLMGDSEISLAFSFRPTEAAVGIASGELPASVRSYIFAGGSIGNVSFLGIPYNAQHKAAAMVMANFLLSPQAQLHAHDPAILGSATVLAMDKLQPSDREKFLELDRSVDGPGYGNLDQLLPEPHPSWVPALEQAWRQRYLAR